MTLTVNEFSFVAVQSTLSAPIMRLESTPFRPNLKANKTRDLVVTLEREIMKGPNFEATISLSSSYISEIHLETSINIDTGIKNDNRVIAARP